MVVYEVVNSVTGGFWEKRRSFGPQYYCHYLETVVEHDLTVFRFLVHVVLCFTTMHFSTLTELSSRMSLSYCSLISSTVYCSQCQRVVRVRVKVR